MESTKENTKIDYSLIAPKPPGGPLRLTECFEVSRPLELDIGFGRGFSLLERITKEEDINLLGIEVRNKYVYQIDEKRRGKGIERLKVWSADAKDILSRCEESEIVDRVFIHFPDPWWKKKHEGRRLIDEGFLQLLAKVLKKNGELFIQTDVEERAQAYQNSIEENEHFKLIGLLEENPFSSVSNRERRAIADGLPIYRILAQRL